VNAAKLVYMQKDEWLRRSVTTADLINADGMSVIWATKFLGRPLTERVAGVDLFWALLEYAEQNRYRPFLLGAEESVLCEAVENIHQRFPHLELAGYQNGYWEQTDEYAIVDRIKTTHPDLLFVGMSTPKKERFIHKYFESLQIPFVMGVGGTLDIVAGLTKRAPMWMQKYGLEWLYRLLQEPDRMIRRYAVTNTLFVFYVLLEKFRFRNFRLNKYRSKC
jgi:N-acetylglucosaminyldiphosphoundecaprenol N-acetyl-beta-D-mannosaminyltransferase